MAKAKQLPSGSWRVQASLTIDGKKITRSFTAETARKAEALALQWQELTKEERNEDITLKTAFERYISAKENVLSPGTIRTYKKMTESNLQTIMGNRLSSLTQENIQRAINIDSATRSPKTMRNINGLLSAVLRMFKPDFVLRVSLPQKKPTEMYIPTENDSRKLMSVVKGKKLEIPVLLAAFGPMRRGEICALTNNDINGNTVTVNKAVSRNSNGEWVTKSPKTFSSYRKIEYPDFVIDKIKDIKGNICPLTPNTITNSFNVLLKENNIPHFRFHDLRHYAVSILHAMNIPDKYIMARGGWRTNYTMNNVYNHAMRDKIDEFNDKISQHFENVYNCENSQ